MLYRHLEITRHFGRANHAAMVLGRVTAIGLFLTQPNQAVGQTLEDALRAANANNATLQAERSRVRSIAETVAQETGALLPELSLNTNAAYAYDLGIDQNDGGARSELPVIASLNLTQPLFRGGSLWAGSLRAKAELRAAKEELRQVEQDTLLAAVTAYADAWRDRATLELRRQARELIADQLDAFERRKKAGAATTTDVAQAEIRSAQARAVEASAQASLARSQAIFTEVTGTNVVEPEIEAITIDLPSSQDEVLALATMSNPQIGSARFLEEAARLEADQVGGNYLPSLDLESSLRYLTDNDSIDDDIDQRAEARIGVRLTVPIYRGGRGLAASRRSDELIKSREADFDAARRLVKQQTVTAWTAYQAAQSRITDLKQSVSSAERARSGIRREYRLGRRTAIDVLDAEQDLVDARTDLVQARRDLVVASFQISSIIGALATPEP